MPKERKAAARGEKVQHKLQREEKQYRHKRTMVVNVIEQRETR